MGCCELPHRRLFLLLVAGAMGLGPVTAGAQVADLPDTLDLSRAVRIAIENNPQLRISQESVDQATAGRTAVWGTFLPRVSLSGGLSRSAFSRTTFVGEEGLSERLPDVLTSSSQGASQGINVGWTVLDGGRRFAELRRVAASVRAARQRADDAERATILNVRLQFLQALRQQELLSQTQRRITDRELELDLARRRYEIAAVERSDVLTAESNLLNARVSLLTEQGQLEDGLRNLVTTMGLSPDEADDLILAGDTGMPDLVPDAEQIVAIAISTDPELVALRAESEAARASMWGARTSYLPSISVSWSWGRGEQYGPEDSFWQFNPGDTSHSFSISASWNLFDGFTREQQLFQASSQARQAEQQLRMRRLEISRDVRNFADQIARLSATLEITQRAFEISRELLEMEQERYRLGTGTFLQLQQAVQQAQSAETSLIEGRYSYLLAWSNLEEYLGGS